MRLERPIQGSLFSRWRRERPLQRSAWRPCQKLTHGKHFVFISGKSQPNNNLLEDTFSRFQTFRLLNLLTQNICFSKIVVKITFFFLFPPFLVRTLPFWSQLRGVGGQPWRSETGNGFKWPRRQFYRSRRLEILFQGFFSSWKSFSFFRPPPPPAKKGQCKGQDKANPEDLIFALG